MTRTTRQAVAAATEVPKAERELAERKGQRDAAATFHRDHPVALRRLHSLDREIDGAAYEMDLEHQPLDGIAPRRPELPQLGTGSGPGTRSWSGPSSSIEDSGWSCRRGQAQHRGTPPHPAGITRRSSRSLMCWATSDADRGARK